MISRSTVAVVLLTASRVAFARNAANPWSVARPGEQEEREDEELLFEDFGEAVAYWGYSWEPYEVTTRDGLKLTLFRLTAGPPEGFVKPELPSSSDSEEDEELKDNESE